MIQLLVSGLLMGLIYALVAAGLSLIFGLMDVVNFAHGELLMLAMFAALLVFRATGLDPSLQLPLVALILAVLGIAIYRGLIGRADRGHDPGLRHVVEQLVGGPGHGPDPPAAVGATGAEEEAGRDRELALPVGQRVRAGLHAGRQPQSNRRHRKTTQTTASTSSGTPKNEFSSVSLGASGVSSPATPASERSGNAP